MRTPPPHSDPQTLLTVNQGCMSLSKYYLEYGSHLARLHRRRCRRRAYALTSNSASHDNHEKINSWVLFSFLYGYDAPLEIKKGAAETLAYYFVEPGNTVPVSLVRCFTVIKTNILETHRKPSSWCSSVLQAK